MVSSIIIDDLDYLKSINKHFSKVYDTCINKYNKTYKYPIVTKNVLVVKTSNKCISIKPSFIDYISNVKINTKIQSNFKYNIYDNNVLLSECSVILNSEIIQNYTLSEIQVSLFTEKTILLEFDKCPEYIEIKYDAILLGNTYTYFKNRKKFT
jgi:hypothetical protein